ncbi:MAG: hypothetical protein GXO09_03105 [Crenarchaeota archaeon]|nr:hypothetical protein [Thermoproteota archaeon]
MTLQTLEALMGLILMLAGPSIVAAVIARIMGLDPAKAARITLYASTLAPILALLLLQAPPLP